VDLITIDIGGTDFEALLTDCVNDPNVQVCRAAILAALAEVARNYPIILSALRDAAGQDTTIAVMTYYNRFRRATSHHSRALRTSSGTAVGQCRRPGGSTTSSAAKLRPLMQSSPRPDDPSSATMTSSEAPTLTSQ